jgi:hydroxymethylbilane synthase
VRRGEEALVAACDDADTHAALRAERAVTRGLGGGCTVPVAAHAERADGGWRLHAFVATPDGSTSLQDVYVGADLDVVAQEALSSLRAAGAEALLADAAP